jgi:hypothetical protein
MVNYEDSKRESNKEMECRLLYFDFRIAEPVSRK